MTFSQAYKRLNDSIAPEEALKAAVLERADAETGKRGRRRRPVVALAVALACLIALGAPMCVLAAENPGFNAMVYQVSPALGQFFKPVNLSCESNGVLLELESAAVDGDTAQAYVTIRDLTGDRIDETVDFYDSALFRTGKDSVGTCRQVDYDPDTKTARFLLTTRTMDGSSIAGNKITFQASCFLSHKTEYKSVEVPVDWEKLPGESPSMEAYFKGGSGSVPLRAASADELEKGGYTEMVRVLQPAEPMDWPVEEIDLTGIGFVDGRLHVQTTVKDNLKKDNHGYFWLEDEEENRIEALYSAYNLDLQMPGEDTRVDYVFQVSPEKSKDYMLKGDFWTSGSYTEGDWEITFPVK